MHHNFLKLYSHSRTRALVFSEKYTLQCYKYKAEQHRLNIKGVWGSKIQQKTEMKLSPKHLKSCVWYTLTRLCYLIPRLFPLDIYLTHSPKMSEKLFDLTVLFNLLKRTGLSPLYYCDQVSLAQSEWSRLSQHLILLLVTWQNRHQNSRAEIWTQSLWL